MIQLWGWSLPFLFLVGILFLSIVGCGIYMCWKYCLHCAEPSDGEASRRRRILNRQPTPRFDPSVRVVVGNISPPLWGRVLPDADGNVESDPRYRIDPCSPTRILVPERMMDKPPTVIPLAVASGTQLLDTKV